MVHRVFVFVLLSAGALLAAEADPYFKLSSLEFGGGNSLQPIIDEIRDARPPQYAAIEAKLLAAANKPEATFACKRFVADMLRIVGSKACVPAVIGWLKNPETAPLATFALQGLRGEEVDQALFNALAGAQGTIKINLVQAIAVRRSSAAISPLAQLAKSADLELGKAALAGLGTIGTPESAAAIKSFSVPETLTGVREQALLDCGFRMIKDSNPAGAKAIFEELHAKSPRWHVATAALNGLVQIDPAGSLPLVLSAMKDSRPQLAIRAAHAAVTLKSDQATSQLSAALPSLAPPVQVALIQALAERGDRAAFPAIRTALASGDESVRAAAARACENLADESAVGPLLALASGNGAVADSAKEMLGRIKQPGIDAALLKQLEESNPATVSTAATVLGARGCRGAMPALLKLAENPDKSIRESAMKAAEMLAGSSDVPALMALLAKAKQEDRDKITQAMWAAVRGVNPKEQKFLTLWKAAPEDKPLRAALLPLAARSGGAEAVRIVEPLTRDSDNALQDAATRALFNWPADGAASQILALLKTTRNTTYKTLAIRALANRLSDKKGALTTPQRLAILREALPLADRPEDKQSLEWAVGKLEGK